MVLNHDLAWKAQKKDILSLWTVGLERKPRVFNSKLCFAHFLLLTLGWNNSFLQAMDTVFYSVFPEIRIWKLFFDQAYEHIVHRWLEGVFSTCGSGFRLKFSHIAVLRKRLQKTERTAHD